ncbi:MAG TPA: phosphomannomutase/phosphoglucomutase [Bacteroidales bacterium]|nr:phosphomannomutase/phosphoglucomutase [Bacteroidales bacterium]
MKAFKAYDIRGVYNRDFDKDDAYKIGFFLPEVLGASKVLVGRDARLSSGEIFENLARGICDAGADVYDAGLCTTPKVYFGTGYFGFDASVQITASHNPKDHNGMKVSQTGAMPVGYDNGLNRIEELMRTRSHIPVAKKGKIFQQNFDDVYLDFLKKHITPLDGMKVCIDLSNGMAGLFARQIFGDSPIYLNDTIDGSFPGHEPNPLEPENIEMLQHAVQHHGADLGIIFDGDADRVMFVDEHGKFISPDLMIALLGHYYADKGLTGTVVQDIRTSKAVGNYLSKMGFRVETWKVGRAFASRKLKELDGIFGGELAGHYYFRDFYYSDSGLLACLILSGVLKKMHEQGITVSQAIATVSQYISSGEINFRIEKKAEAMEAVKRHFFDIEKPMYFADFDGYRLDYQDFWINIRPSNTEPYLRFIAEAENLTRLNEVIGVVREICNRPEFS